MCKAAGNYITVDDVGCPVRESGLRDGALSLPGARIFVSAAPHCISVGASCGLAAITAFTGHADVVDALGKGRVGERKGVSVGGLSSSQGGAGCVAGNIHAPVETIERDRAGNRLPATDDGSAVQNLVRLDAWNDAIAIGNPCIASVRTFGAIDDV